jgi:CRISPR-associated Csx14 family protein
MSTLINTVGTSPMVVSEVFQYIRNVDEKLRNVALIFTSDKEVRAGVFALIGAILSKYPDVHFQLQEMNISDIYDKDSLIKFIDYFAEAVIKERDHSSLYLNVSGGRKVESIAVAMYGGFADAKVVYNVIHKDVKNFNEKYERIKDYILEDFSHCQIKETREIYLKRKDDYDPVFFPNTSKLIFLEIPIIRIPDSEKEYIRRCIKGINLEDSDIEDFRIKAYADSGFITYDRHRTYATDLGEVILKML